MVREAISSEEAVGKTIKQIMFGFNACILLIFTDDTMCYISAADSYGDLSVDFSSVADLKDFYTDEVIEAGLATEEEYEAFYEQEHLRHEEQERATYLRLKEKYGE